MTLIRHCIIDTDTNKVVNIIDYETTQTGIPLGFEQENPNLICVASEDGQIGSTYANGEITNLPEPEVTLPNIPRGN